MAASSTERRRPRLGRLALRLLARDLAGGRLLVMLLASIVAVASTAAVSLLVARVEQVLLAESSALLAADLAISANAPPARAYTGLANRLGLTTSWTASLRSVVSHGERLQLVNLKAAGPGYPLRGELVVASAPGQAARAVAAGPPRGEVWAEPRLLQLLGVAVGDRLGIGNLDLVLGGVLVHEPDRGVDPFGLAPHVLMNGADLAGSGLVLPGSRIGYTTLVAGAPTALARFRAALVLAPGDRLSDPREARPELRSAFRQAERFLALAAFTGVALAVIGIALAANVYRDHHEPTIAILKTLGLARRQVIALLAGELLLLALLAAGAGCALAWLLHGRLLVALVPELAAGDGALPLAPFVHGTAIALVTLGGFALPPLVRLAGVPVAMVLARDRAGLAPPGGANVAAMLLASLAIAPWHLGDARLVAYALAGMLGSAAVLALVAWLLVRLLARLRHRTRMGWRFGLANVARRARLSVLQTTAIGLGIAVVLLLGVVRNDLVAQWQGRLPAGAPNQFLINIQPGEVDALAGFLAAEGIAQAALYPMVRGRLTAINGRRVDPDAYDDARARRLADREFNLSWARTPKPDNRIVAGTWWNADGRGEYSVETGIAETLGLALGDELVFTIGSAEARGRITSLREVQWDNFEVNFFVVGSPDLLTDQAATYITSFHLPAGRGDAMARLVERFPSVTAIDVDALMVQVRQVMERVSAALLWVFGGALAAGALVLAAAVQASQRERLLDAVLLKTLGASRRFVRRTVLVEFAVLGLVAGAVGSIGALLTGWLLADQVLDFHYAPDWRLPAAGVAAGLVLVALVGSAVIGRSLDRPVTSGLRDAL